MVSNEKYRSLRDARTGDRDEGCDSVCGYTGVCCASFGLTINVTRTYLLLMGVGRRADQLSTTAAPLDDLLSVLCVVIVEELALSTCTLRSWYFVVVVELDRRRTLPLFDRVPVSVPRRVATMSVY